MRSDSSHPLDPLLFWAGLIASSIHRLQRRFCSGLSLPLDHCTTKPTFYCWRQRPATKQKRGESGRHRLIRGNLVVGRRRLLPLVISYRYH